MEETCSQGSSALERRVRNSVERKDDGRNESRMERRNNLSSKSWKSQGSEVCSLSDRIYSYGEEGRLNGDGTSST